jgi:trk system potassium uptake protein TrkH
MTDSTASLRHAVRFPVLRYYLGQLSVVLATLTLVPLAGALLLGEERLAGDLSIVLIALALLWLAGRRATMPRRLQENEALVVVALTFVFTPFLMVLPFAGAGFRLEDALFESVSAVTTTGLSTMPDLTVYSPGLLLLRAWLQWFGGLGIAVFSVALVLGHHAGARSLTGLDIQDLPASARTYARQVLSVYVVLSLAAAGLLWIALGDGMQALLHALTSVSTGGFSGYDNSLADMPSSAGPVVTIGAALLGATPLVLYYQSIRRRRWELGRDPEWRILPAVALAGALLLALILHVDQDMSWPQALYHGGLLGVSAQTTAGFSSLDVGELGDPAKLLLILAMLTGGSVGSTAGGIKLLRLLILLRLLGFLIRRTGMPAHAVAALRLGGRALEPEDVQRALAVVALFLLTVLVSWFVFVSAGLPPLDALFDVVSATGTVGLSTGVVGPDLAPGLKLLTCLNMLLGRLEILALLVVLYPRTWIGRRIETT